jgi:uncharacterized protein (TIGR03435 family)
MCLRTPLLLVLAVALAAQPAFEVASIKLHDIFKPDQRKWGFSLSGTTVWLIGMPLVSLVTEAYGVESYQVTGGPSWASDFVGAVYDITAKAGGESAPTKEEARKMLQTLLADRFQLQLHHETRELPVYELVIGKHGPKLKESASGALFSNHQGPSGQAIRMLAVHESMAQLADQIGVYAGRHVIDKTGLTNTYDFTIEFTADSPRGPAGPDGADPVAPSIFTALEEQLGLKLEPQKRPTEILIIDRAEKPSGN